jgi:hypothetical protein
MRARAKAIDAARVLCREFGFDMASDKATKILDVLESERKCQDRDTRHACAEAVIGSQDPHGACINARAV